MGEGGTPGAAEASREIEEQMGIKNRKDDKEYNKQKDREKQKEKERESDEGKIFNFGAGHLKGGQNNLNYN